jgi:hypothetical protein
VNPAIGVWVSPVRAAAKPGFADAGPFEPDDCCVARPPQSVAGTDALILLRVGEDD